MPTSNHLHSFFLAVRLSFLWLLTFPLNARGLDLSLTHARLITSSLTFILRWFCKDLKFFFFYFQQIACIKSSLFVSLPDPRAKPNAVQGGPSLETYKSLCMQPETADKISAADLKQSRGGANVLWVWPREWAEHTKRTHVRTEPIPANSYSMTARTNHLHDN